MLGLANSTRPRVLQLAKAEFVYVYTAVVYTESRTEKFASCAIVMNQSVLVFPTDNLKPNPLSSFF